MIGSEDSGSRTSGVEIFHYLDGLWSLAYRQEGESATPYSASYQLCCLGVAGNGEAWAGGGVAAIIQLGTTSDSASTAYLLHFVNGRWTRVSELPSRIISMSMASAGDGLATDGSNAYRYHNGAWSTVNLSRGLFG